MVEPYLENKYLVIDTFKDFHNIVKGSLVKVNSKISKKYNESVKNCKIPQNLDEIIKEVHRKLSPADIEYNIRQSKIVEANKVKKDLEAKLKFITSSIESLNVIEEFPQRQKPNLLQSENRQHYYEEERQKVEKLKKKLKIYSKQQKDRQENLEKKQKSQIEELNLQKIKEEEEEIRKLEEKHKAYQDYLQKMKEKAESRKKDLQQNFALCSQVVKKEKPLFVQLSDRYLMKVEMPELEKRKRELNEKRKLNVYSTKAVMDHAKWYETIKSEKSKKKTSDPESQSVDRKTNLNEFAPSKWYENLMKEENRKKAEKLREEKEFMKRINKREQYASFVKQLYSPFVSTQSTKVLKTVKNSIEKPEKRQKSEEKIVWKPHKFKANPLIPATVKRKQLEAPDYLRQLREKRENKEEEEEGSKNETERQQANSELQIILPEAISQSIKKKSKLFDLEIRKKELKISCSPKINLRLSQEVNDMYLSSIKAKLSFLEQSNN